MTRRKRSNLHDEEDRNGQSDAVRQDYGNERLMDEEYAPSSAAPKRKRSMLATFAQ